MAFVDLEALGEQSSVAVVGGMRIGFMTAYTTTLTAASISPKGFNHVVGALGTYNSDIGVVPAYSSFISTVGTGDPDTVSVSCVHTAFPVFMFFGY